jgi:hypothetical protein
MKCSAFCHTAQHKFLKDNRPAFNLGSCSVYISALKMEASFISETSFDFQRAASYSVSEKKALQDALFP